MKRTLASALALLCTLALSGCGVSGGSSPGGESVLLTQQLEYVKMPTEFPDTFDVDPLEGWVLRMRYKPVVPSCWVFKEGADPTLGLKVTRLKGESAERKMTDRKSSTPFLARQEVLNYRLEDYSSRYHELAVLPERDIGGERAFGLRYRIVDEKFHAVDEEFYVIRHDGLWTFTLQSGKNQDAIDPDTYRVLDTFRWTGPFDEASLPPSAEPSPKASPSESEG